MGLYGYEIFFLLGHTMVHAELISLLTSRFLDLPTHRLWTGVCIKACTRLNLELDPPLLIHDPLALGGALPCLFRINHHRSPDSLLDKTAVTERTGSETPGHLCRELEFFPCLQIAQPRGNLLFVAPPISFGL